MDMPEEKSRLQRAMTVGAIMGAVLGAGAAFLLIKAPSDLEEKPPLTGGEILSLTSAASVLVRHVDDFRRRL